MRLRLATILENQPTARLFKARADTATLGSTCTLTPQCNKSTHIWDNELVRRSRNWKDLKDSLVLALPPDILQRVVYAVVDDKTLIIFTDSPAVDFSNAVL